MSFVDRVHILVQAGSGGNGCESFQPRTDRKHVPTGGDGGNGGSVIFRADSNAPGLGSFRFRQHLIAESGGHGGSEKKRGRNGKDLVVLVPIGTRLFDRAHNLLVRDLGRGGDEVILCQGGRGGMGNQGGHATLGEKGASLDLELTLRIPADIFLVGLPSSGKSTLLNRLTGSHAKAEHYPFSTQSPEIGVCRVEDYESVQVCELPSLYAASSEGRGLGHGFLRHLESAPYILYVIDPVSSFASSLEEGLSILKNQVKIYNEKFSEIPYAVAVNKMDLPEAQEKAKKEKFRPKAPVFWISAVTGEGLDELKHHFYQRKTQFSK